MADYKQNYSSKTNNYKVLDKSLAYVNKSGSSIEYQTTEGFTQVKKVVAEYEKSKSTTTKRVTQNSTTVVTKKYTPKGEYSPTTQLYDSVSDDTVTISTTTEQSGKESEVKSMANSSKIMTATGAGVFAAGSVFVVLGAIKHSKIAKQKTE